MARNTARRNAPVIATPEERPTAQETPAMPTTDTVTEAVEPVATGAVARLLNKPAAAPTEAQAAMQAAQAKALAAKEAHAAAVEALVAAKHTLEAARLALIEANAEVRELTAAQRAARTPAA